MCLSYIELDGGKVHKNYPISELSLFFWSGSQNDLYTSTQQNAVKNTNMMIVYGMFSIKHHTAHHHESVIVYFTGGKYIKLIFIFLFSKEAFKHSHF